MVYPYSYSKYYDIICKVNKYKKKKKKEKKKCRQENGDPLFFQLSGMVEM